MVFRLQKNKGIMTLADFLTMRCYILLQLP
jgi:hypothetical protein